MSACLVGQVPDLPPERRSGTCATLPPNAFVGQPLGLRRPLGPAWRAESPPQGMALPHTGPGADDERTD